MTDSSLVSDVKLQRNNLEPIEQIEEPLALVTDVNNIINVKTLNLNWQEQDILEFSAQLNK